MEKIGKIVIGVDPHKLSAAIEVVDHRERVLVAGRFATDKAGYAAMRKHVASWPERTWAVEGSNGAGRPLAQRLLADGESVVDAPAKLAARCGCSTPAMPARPTPRCPRGCGGSTTHADRAGAQLDEDLVALRLLVDRRDELSARRVQTVNRLHRLLAELIPGGAGKDLTASKAKQLLATVKPRSLVGRTTRRMAVDEIATWWRWTPGSRP